MEQQPFELGRENAPGHRVNKCRPLEIAAYLSVQTLLSVKLLFSVQKLRSVQARSSRSTNNYG